MMEDQIKHIIREETLFAGIRKPVKSREELIPRMQAAMQICGDKITGPVVNIFRFDTLVDGFDSGNRLSGRFRSG